MNKVDNDKVDDVGEVDDGDGDASKDAFKYRSWLRLQWERMRILRPIRRGMRMIRSRRMIRSKRMKATLCRAREG